MRYTWSEGKRKTNLKQHGLDFRDVHLVFDGITLTFEDDRFEYGEHRFVTLGLLDGILVSLVHTEGMERIRVISFRKATRHEQKIYFQSI